MRLAQLFSPLLFAAALLSGCASYTGAGLQPGVASQAEVRAQMGTPAAVHKARPGAGYAESWEYPHGPAGRHTFMVRFDAAGKLVRIDQVLVARTLTAITYGTDTQADVRALLGRPGTITGPNRLYGGDIWGYAAYDGQRKIILSVSFDAQGRAQAAGESPDPEETSPNDGVAG